MSWLSRVRNGIPFLPKRQTTDTLWHKCKKCDAMVFTKEWEDNLRSARAATITTASAPAPLRPAVRRWRIRAAARARRARGPAALPRHQALHRPDQGRPPRPSRADAFLNARGTIDGGPRSSACRTSPSWAGRWASRSAPPSSPASAPRSPRKCPYIIFTAAGRRAHAGRHPQPDADAAHDRRAASCCARPGCPTSWC
jgi:acetyl-CoA carboxylase carboxyl transferase subunit beta